MLPRQHRIKSGEDFRLIMRTGLRTNTPDFTVFVSKDEAPVTRFGFVVSKAVGSAVTRNRIKRQLRAIAYGLLSADAKRDVVVRVNQAAASSNFEDFKKNLAKGLLAVQK